MRDRWLRDEFTVVSPVSPSDAEPVDHNDHQQVPAANSMDDEDAIRLLMDHGIAEDKAKIRIQVIQFACVVRANRTRLVSSEEIQSTKSEQTRGCISTEELVNIFKELSTRPEIYHLLVR